MSQYGPCTICGIYTSVGPYEDIICSRCEEVDEPYRPEFSLYDYQKENNLNDEELHGLSVHHSHLGEGVVVRIGGMEVTVEFNKDRSNEVNVASDCLEFLDSNT